jgi:hypothetical protein
MRIGPPKGGLAYTTQSIVRSRANHSANGVGFWQSSKVAEELQLPSAMQSREPFKKQAPEQSRQYPHMEKEPRLADDPPVAVRGQAPAGHDYVDMGVVRERRTPGM